MGLWESYCDDTSLHGYQYVGRYCNDYYEVLVICRIPQNNSFLIHRKERRWFWVPAVLISIAAGVFFLVINLIDYMNSTTVTNIQSSTSSLNNIYYPSVTVCNTNQIR